MKIFGKSSVMQGFNSHELNEYTYAQLQEFSHASAKNTAKKMAQMRNRAMIGGMFVFGALAGNVALMGFMAASYMSYTGHKENFLNSRQNEQGISYELGRREAFAYQAQTQGLNVGEQYLPPKQVMANDTQTIGYGNPELNKLSYQELVDKNNALEASRKNSMFTTNIRSALQPFLGAGALVTGALAFAMPPLGVAALAFGAYAIYNGIRADKKHKNTLQALGEQNRVQEELGRRDAFGELGYKHDGYLRPDVKIPPAATQAGSQPAAATTSNPASKPATRRSRLNPRPA